MAQFFYDNQIRRFLVQFAKIFSNWYVTRGKDPNGNDIIVRVPIMYGDSSRQAATIIANNSSNNLPSTPQITYYITGLEYDQKRTQEPYFVDKVNVRQRLYDEETGTYDPAQGQAFTVERLMPVPYTLRIQVDFWTSNYQQKLQLIEQLGTLFNPGLEIQSTDNFIDWTSLSVVYQDGLTFSSRSIPQGTGNPIDIMSWKFYIPIWLSTSVKLKKFGVIHKIIASIFKGDSLLDMQDDDLLMGTRQKITPLGYQVLLINNTLQLLPANQPFYPPNTDLDNPPAPNTDLYWTAYLNLYGKIKPGISQIWLQNPYLDNEIVGTISFNPLDDRILLYDIDAQTLPQNTLPPVNSVVDPHLIGPNAGLPGPINGQRYLIVEDIGAEDTSTPAWGDLIANRNDIIQYNATTSKWFVAFNSVECETVEFVTNLTTNIQYRYADGVWMKSYEGWYDQGDYSIVI